MTVGEVFRDARNADPAFDRYSTPDKPLLGYLAQWERSLMRRLLAVYPEPLLTCYEDYVLPFADFENGEEVPAAFHVQAGRLLYKDGRQSRPEEFVLCTKEELGAPPRRFAAAIVGGRIYLSGSNLDWRDVREFRVYYVPQPEADALQNEESEFTIIESARDAMIQGAAYYLATRQPKEVDVALRLTMRDQAASEWIAQETSQRRANVGRIRRRR